MALSSTRVGAYKFPASIKPSILGINFLLSHLYVAINDSEFFILSIYMRFGFLAKKKKKKTLEIVLVLRFSSQITLFRLLLHMFSGEFLTPLQRDFKLK